MSDAGSAGLPARVRALIAEPVPLPGSGQTAERHRRFFAAGCEDLSLARLAEAHWDALAILAEAGSRPREGALYGVWAAETPTQQLRVEGLAVSGRKPFCSGAGLVDRALVTVLLPTPQLVDVDLTGNVARVRFDDSSWQTHAFAATRTATATFDELPITAADLVGEAGFYLQRPGFWHGACGPAACWAGGAAGLVEWAKQQRRHDAHTLAHLGAMEAGVWAMQAVLKSAGDEIDAAPQDAAAAHRRALVVRHLIEQACTDILRRFARAYGPQPLAMDAAMSKRYQELDLYLRQCHAERDLEALGHLVLAPWRL